jgi:4-amino-4-deoxy-L-arabinose transferase-like glycosyltransferase
VSYGLLLAFGLFLLFYHLDVRLLWGDEAETATLARNVLRFGYPKTFDGLNRISLFGAKIDNAADTWVWSPWLQEYVAAASFFLFGPTTWAARAPFALIGWLCLPLLGWVVYRIYRDHRMALAGMALLASSEVFLLHARQCRYYSISVFAEILFVYSLYCWLAKDRKAWWLLLLSLLIQFYSNYIIATANLPILLLLAWNLRGREKRAVLRLGLSLALLLLLVSPWVWYARLWRQSSALSDQDRARKVAHYFREFHFHFAPLAIGILPLAGWLASKRHPGSVGAAGSRETTENLSQPDAAVIRAFERLLVILLPVYALMITLPPGAFLRYLLPLLPAACLLSAVWVFRYLRWRVVAVGSIAMLCLSNAPAIGTGYPWRGAHKLRSPLFDFVGGLTRPYRDRLADVLAYLDREARPGQTIVVFDPEFPLIFYTPCQVIDARLQGDRPLAPLPDWILPESASGLVEGPSLTLPAPLQPFYETITLPVHASARLGSIPEPDVYHYDSAPLAPYVLYKRKNSP